MFVNKIIHKKKKGFQDLTIIETTISKNENYNAMFIVFKIVSSENKHDVHC